MTIALIYTPKYNVPFLASSKSVSSETGMPEVQNQQLYQMIKKSTSLRSSLFKIRTGGHNPQCKLCRQVQIFAPL